MNVSKGLDAAEELAKRDVRSWDGAARHALRANDGCGPQSTIGPWRKELPER